MPLLTKWIMGSVYDFYRMGLDAIEARIPFRLEHGVCSDPATIYIRIINHTKDTPLFVHQVRIHFGQPDYTYSFILEPSATQEIKPRDRKDFTIAYAIGSRIARRLIVDKSQMHPALENMPSFEHPIQLLHAMANGPKRDSWVEIDFNEFHNRRFRRGKIKADFQRVIEKWKQSPGRKI
jgi:hypothetical protein